jgi:hypothetical protein
VKNLPFLSVSRIRYVANIARTSIKILAAKMPLGKISLFGGDADSPVCRKAPTGTNHPAAASASLARF